MEKITEVEVIPAESVEVLEQKGGMARSTKFTNESFEDTRLMVYEKSNDFALSYYGISRNEQSLLCAGLVSAYNVNKKMPYTPEEIASGIEVHVPIQHVAKMMGYDTDDKTKKSYYNAIKTAAQKLTQSKSILLESPDKKSFSVFNVVSQVDYNKNRDGRVTYKFSPGASELFLNNKDNFTLYSLILTNRMEKNGKNGAVRLHEVLRTDLFRIKGTDQSFSRYYDFVDLKCKLFLINTNNDTVKTILDDPRYSLDRIANNDKLAYERTLAIESLDVETKATINKIKNSDEYKRIQIFKKGQEYKEAKKKIKALSADSPEYEDIYINYIKPVNDMDQKMQVLQDAIICQYTEWSDFKKRILMPAQKAFLETVRDTDLMDMMFEYEPSFYKGKVIGIHFTIYTIEGYIKKEKEKGVQMSIFDYLDKDKDDSRQEIYEEVGGANKSGGSVKRKKRKAEKVDVTIDKFDKYIKLTDRKYEMSAGDIYTISKLADFDVIREKYDLLDKQQDVESPVAWMIAAIKGDWKDNEGGGKRYKNGFNKMMTGEYAGKTSEELEKMLGVM